MKRSDAPRYYLAVRKQTKLGSRTISYFEADGGAAPDGHATRTLVWLHAFPLSAGMWDAQLAATPRGWRAIAPDFPGFGGTDPLPPGRPASLDEFAADVIDLLHALHIDRAVVAGASMGGYVAFALVRLSGSLVSGLILADTRAGADSPQGLDGRRRTIELVERGGSAALADDLAGKLLGETTRRERPDLVARFRAMVTASPATAVITASRAMMARPDSTPLLSSVHCPALVIVGREDTVTPPAESEALHAAIGGSSLVVVERGGHLSGLEQPAAFNDAVAAFLMHRV